MSEELNEAEQKQLLKWARDTICAALGGEAATPPEKTEKLTKQAGAFVTLHKLGQLRGCIGTFMSSKPLLDTISEMAISASQKDPRFAPVAASEMKDIDLEISVLSPLREIKDVAEIEVGKHGIYISRGYYSGVLLPQVATEQGWDLDTFLCHTCLKAGLPQDCWKDTKCKIEIFSAQVFGEKQRTGC